MPLDFTSSYVVICNIVAIKIFTISLFGNDFVFDVLKTDWKLIAKHLFEDIDAAHGVGDAVQEQRTRLLLWAMAGPHGAPPEFYCPIALEIMEDPVVLMETAVTYDRKSVEVWISPHGPQKCPVTKKQLSNPSFIENKALKMLIEDWRHETILEEVQ